MLKTINQKSFHIEELSALQFGWQINFTQLSAAESESAVSLVQSDNLGVCHFQFNASFDQRLRAKPGYYSFGLPDPGTAGSRVDGKSANPGAIVVFPQHNEAYGASFAGFHGYGAHIKATFLESMAETVFEMPLRLMVPTAGVYALTEVQFRQLSWVMTQWRQMAAQIVTADDRSGVAMLAHREEALAIAILNALSHSAKANETQHLKSDRALRLVMDYVNSTPQDEITAVELCTLAGCSQRWLEQSFKMRFGISPKAYVKCLRLSRLRQDLLQASHGEGQSIIELASTYGFWHMGQLAADYRKVYGELPSATLKRH